MNNDGLPTYDDVVNEHRKALDKHSDEGPMEPTDYDQIAKIHVVEESE